MTNPFVSGHSLGALPRASTENEAEVAMVLDSDIRMVLHGQSEALQVAILVGCLVSILTEAYSKERIKQILTNIDRELAEYCGVEL